LLTFAQAVAEIARAAGRVVQFESVSMEVFTKTLTDQGVPADVVGFLEYLFGEVLDGRNAQLADGVERALGRKARDFGEFARRTAATCVWGERRA
jgi:hypothetical protein